MRIHNTTYSHFLLVMIPIFLNIIFGFMFVFKQGGSSTNIIFVHLMILFGLVSGYFILTWYNYHKKTSSERLNVLMSYTVELERLLLLVEPKIVDQVLAVKELTEKEISTLILRFSVIYDELNQIFDFTNQPADGQKLENRNNIKNNVEKIREEIDIVLEALQFQDRISQILLLVQNNLATLRETLEKIQHQGTDRHQKMLKVEEMLTNIQIEYETVRHHNSRATSAESTDNLTLF